MIKRFTNLMLLMGAIALIIAGCSGAGTQEEEQPEETFSFIEGHAPVWDNAIAQVVAIAEAMPEEAYGFRPHDSVRTFAEQLMHIGGSSKFISNYFLKDMPPDQSEAPDIASMSKAEVIAAVRADLTEVGNLFKTFSDQTLTEKCANKTFGGNEISRLEALLFVHDHLTNHKAKANLYVRIHGEEPPPYGYY